MKLRVYHETRGGHVHCRVFVNGAQSGNLVFRKEEWLAFLASFGPGPSWSRGNVSLELIPEEA